MDERPVQLVKDIRKPLAGRPGRIRRYDREYKRAGTACVFLFTGTLRQWRDVRIRAHRTAVDWAQEMAKMLENRYPHAEKVIVICDQLNTHMPASFYKAFPLAKARRLAEGIEIHHTPKHGSWLNLAECELSALSRHCLRRRTPSVRSLIHKVTPWARERNRRQSGIDWQFTAADARIKLISFCPHIQRS